MRPLALLLLLTLAGCSDSHASPGFEAPIIPTYRTATPGNRIVIAPAWLAKFPAARDHAFGEIDAQGLPRDQVEYRIQDPGLYSFLGSPTGLAAGHTDMRTQITVAWTATRSAPWLPALAHEVGHVRTQNPCAGHAAGCKP